MKSEVWFNMRLLAWCLAFTERIGDQLFVYAPPEATFEEKPTQEQIDRFSTEARAAFDKKKP